MSLPPGTRLGPYEIVAPLGAGAMGEVYRARDPRLGREVAIKLMHQDASASADRRARFEREARAVAALNHPNVLAIHDFGSQDGRFYIVSELVEGESLRARIDRGSISVKELYGIAVQFADGLAAAHAAGITHRDLKPENLMLTGSTSGQPGRVKILDFGLARQTARIASASPDATQTQMETQPGTVLGTVAYMSPEQVRGALADHRSDQFAFGVVLYEMAGGKRPFVSETQVQTMSAILTEEPQPLEARLPPPLRWTIARCLEKDPAARYESTRDLYQDLRNQQEHLSDLSSSTAVVALPEDVAKAPSARSPAPPRRPWLPVAVAIAAALLGAVGHAWWASHNANEIGRYRFTPMEVSWAFPYGALWSPDGKAFAYSAMVGRVRQVFLRYLNSPAPTQLTHGSMSTSVVGWTRDGKRVLVSGPSPQINQPGMVAVFSIPVFGGDPELVGTVEAGGSGEIFPDRKVARVVTPDGNLEVKTGSLGSPLQRYQPGPFETKDFHNTPILRFSPDGRSILLLLDLYRGRTAWRLPIPPGREAPQRVLPGLPGFGGTPAFSWFPDSRHIVLSLQDKHEDEHQHLWIADVASGRRRQITNGLSSEYAPAVSPDGKAILFLQSKTEYSLVSVSLETAAPERMLSSDLFTGMPAWALNQEKFAYVSGRNGPMEIWMRGDGYDRPLVGPAAFPTGTTNWFVAPALSPGADRLVFMRVEAIGNAFNWISSVSGGPPVRLTNESNVSEDGGCWSPDGKYFAYIRERLAKLGSKIV